MVLILLLLGFVVWCFSCLTDVFCYDVSFDLWFLYCGDLVFLGDLF